jgi:DNA topoisomerase-2
MSESGESHHITWVNDVDHVIGAGDFYIGQERNTVSPPVDRYVWDSDSKTMKLRQNFVYPNGLVKIYDELIVNAADNSQRNVRPTTTIWCTINTKLRKFILRNDGDNIPILPGNKPSMHDESVNAYQPELAFFHPRSSSHYNKTNKTTGGKFGLGAKLASILSQHFQVKLCDGKREYKQSSTYRLQTVSPPIIREVKSKAPYIEVEYIPDLEFFYPPGKCPDVIESDIVDLIVTRLYDIAATCGVKVRYKIDDDKKWNIVPLKSFQHYIHLFLDEDRRNVMYHETDRWQVAVVKNPLQRHKHVSFVNGINTFGGGQHVNYILLQVFQMIREKFPDIPKYKVADSVFVFVNARIDDPSFDSQCKETLTTLPNKFGSTCILNPKTTMPILKRAGVLQRIESSLEKRNQEKFDREIRHSMSDIQLSKIEHFDDAQWAGTRKWKQTTLILTEGKSALSLVRAGFTVVGRDKFGAMALRGKGMNCDSNTIESIRNNKEFVNICRVSGLQLTSCESKRRYNRTVIMTDQDVDGSHITALLIFMYYKFWPHLLKNGDFLYRMITPIVIARAKGRHTFQNIDEHSVSTQMAGDQKHKIRYFFTEQDFHDWLTVQQQSGHSDRFDISYYKGLSSSDKELGKLYFKNKHLLIKRFLPITKQDEDALNMAFSDSSDVRKQWIENYDPNVRLPYDTQKDISIRDFIYHELVHYAVHSLSRGLPDINGMTRVQVKALYSMYTVRKRIGKQKSIKIEQLANDISNDTQYHHGSVSIGGALIRLGQRIVGKNNINLFADDGIFGDRTDGGAKTAGAQRYIKTFVNEITTHIFPAIDDPCLQQLQEEDKKIEFAQYAPIIPMLLINGASGIATGYASNIPSYHPIDMIDRLILKLQGKPYWSQEPVPYYRGFTGQVELNQNSHHTIGTIQEHESQGKWSYTVTELPIGLWSNTFKIKHVAPLMETQIIKNQKGKALKQEPIVKSITELDHDDEQIRFYIDATTRIPNPTKTFKLSRKHTHLLNCVEWDEKKGPVVLHFDSIKDIFDHFFNKRLMVYQKRKQYMTKYLASIIPQLQQKRQFVEDMVHGKIPIGTPTQNIKQYMKQCGYNPQYVDNFLAMSIVSCTKEKIDILEKEIDKVQQQHQFYVNIQPEQMWIQDLQNIRPKIRSLMY